MAARIRRLAELRESTARQARVQASRAVEDAESSLSELQSAHDAAEDELLDPSRPLTGAHMQLLQDARMQHRGRRAQGEATIAERKEEHEARVEAHQQSIAEQRGKEALEERAIRELRDEVEGREARERDEIASTRIAAASDRGD